MNLKLIPSGPAALFAFEVLIASLTSLGTIRLHSSCLGLLGGAVFSIGRSSWWAGGGGSIDLRNSKHFSSKVEASDWSSFMIGVRSYLRGLVYFRAVKMSLP